MTTNQQKLQMAAEMGVPFFGCIPIDPQIIEACDAGRPYVKEYLAGTLETGDNICDH